MTDPLAHIQAVHDKIKHDIFKARREKDRLEARIEALDECRMELDYALSEERNKPLFAAGSGEAK